MYPFFKHLFTIQRLPFTLTYFCSMLGTLYFSLIVEFQIAFYCSISLVISLVISLGPLTRLTFTLITEQSKSYIFVLMFCIVQFISLLWYYASYLPGGTSGLTVEFSLFGLFFSVRLRVAYYSTVKHLNCLVYIKNVCIKNHWIASLIW